MSNYSFAFTDLREAILHGRDTDVLIEKLCELEDAVEERVVAALNVAVMEAEDEWKADAQRGVEEGLTHALQERLTAAWLRCGGTATVPAGTSTGWWYAKDEPWATLAEGVPLP